MRTINTDVLVIGGGSAGMRAAISAREAGAEVALAYKSGGNCTSVAAGGFAAAMPEATNDSPEKHFLNTMENARGLADEKLVRILVERGPDALKTMLSWGLKFYTYEDGKIRPFRSGGHSEPRTYRCQGGNVTQFFRTMSARVLDAGTVPLRNFTVMNLLLDNGTVCGACGIDSTGVPSVVRAKAVILATGGFGGAFKRTTNPMGITGEGYEMGFEAGCTLADLEFVQFMPTSFVAPPPLVGKIVNDTIRGEGAVMRNAAGEQFMKTYDPVYADMAGRDILSIAIASEVAQGRGTSCGGVYLDARGVAPETTSQSLGATARLMRLGIDPARDMLEVAPAVHFTCGGIVTDEHCATGVEGLFAVGEVISGVHGANRLGGNAMTETLVFGDIAGKSAAHHAAASSGFSTARDERLEDYARGSISVSRNAEKLRSAMDTIKMLYWDAVGVLRSEEPLLKAEQHFGSLATELANDSPALFTLHENIRREHLVKMAKLAAKVAKAARLRRESRGTHYRTDFTKIDETCARHITFNKKNT